MADKSFDLSHARSQHVLVCCGASIVFFDPTEADADPAATRNGLHHSSTGQWERGVAGMGAAASRTPAALAHRLQLAEGLRVVACTVSHSISLPPPNCLISPEAFHQYSSRRISIQDA